MYLPLCPSQSKSKYITKFSSETVREMSSLSICQLLSIMGCSYVLNILTRTVIAIILRWTTKRTPWRNCYKLQGLKTSSCEWVIFKWSLRTFVVIVRRVQTDPPNSPLCPGASWYKVLQLVVWAALRGNVFFWELQRQQMWACRLRSALVSFFSSVSPFYVIESNFR